MILAWLGSCWASGRAALSNTATVMSAVWLSVFWPIKSLANSQPINPAPIIATLTGADFWDFRVFRRCWKLLYSSKWLTAKMVWWLTAILGNSLECAPVANTKSRYASVVWDASLTNERTTMTCSAALISVTWWKFNRVKFNVSAIFAALALAMLSASLFCA